MEAKNNSSDGPDGKVDEYEQGDYADGTWRDTTQAGDAGVMGVEVFQKVSFERGVVTSHGVSKKRDGAEFEVI